MIKKTFRKGYVSATEGATNLKLIKIVTHHNQQLKPKKFETRLGAANPLLDQPNPFHLFRDDIIILDSRTL